MQSGHLKLQMFVGSIVRMDGFPHKMFFCNNADKANEALVFNRFDARRGVNDRTRFSALSSLNNDDNSRNILWIFYRLNDNKS